MAKGSAFSRAIRYFMEGDIEELRYILARGAQILSERTPQVPGPQGVRKLRKRRANAAEHRQDNAKLEFDGY